MRIISLLILIGGLIGWLYIAVHLVRIPTIKNLREKKKWLPYCVALSISILLWIFSFVYYTYIMAFSIYLIGFFVISDIFWLLASRFRGIRVSNFGIWWAKYIYNGTALIVLCIVLTIAGALNADTIKVTDYDISLEKEMKPLKVVMVSDVHLGTGVYAGDISEFDERINKLKPDVLCFVGDVFDERTTEVEMKTFEESLKNVKTKYGMFYVYGNHDLGKYNARKAWSKSDIDRTLINGGVTILDDEAVLVAESVYIVGRRDFSMTKVPEEEEERKSISQLTKNLNQDFPIILLDHRPENLYEAETAGVDLQLSGHTHAGQLAPARIIEKYFLHNSEVSYGHKKNGDFNIVVSSGYGTWGMPVRLGSPCEIVNINLSTSKDLDK